MYSVEQINYILYNNRTYENVVKNFMPDIKYEDMNLLLEIGNQLKFVNKLINKSSSVIIDKSKLDLNAIDIELYPNQIENIKISSRDFNQNEIDLINKKKIPKEIIEIYDISPLSQFKDNDILNKLGVTTHPILETLIGNGISDGLIIPLYNDGKLINTVFRKINEVTRLKYGITVPSLNFWGDVILENKEIWLCEGLFDMMAIKYNGKQCISASSCNLNDFHYFQIIKNKPKSVNIFTDNDISGYKSALKSKKLFGLNGIESHIFSSKNAKDAAEHFFELELNWDLVDEIQITNDMINREEDIHDIIKYIENRNF
jgi:hypothetical protein